MRSSQVCRCSSGSCAMAGMPVVSCVVSQLLPGMPVMLDTSQTPKRHCQAAGADLSLHLRAGSRPSYRHGVSAGPTASGVYVLGRGEGIVRRIWRGIAKVELSRHLSAMLMVRYGGCIELTEEKRREPRQSRLHYGSGLIAREAVRRMNHHDISK